MPGKKGWSNMFCGNCGRQLSNSATACDVCRLPIGGTSTFWHYKNSLRGTGIWLSCVVAVSLGMAALSHQGDNGSRAGLGLLGGLLFFGAIVFALFSTSKRAAGWALQGAANTSSIRRSALGQPPSWHFVN